MGNPIILKPLSVTCPIKGWFVRTVNNRLEISVEFFNLYNDIEKSLGGVMSIWALGNRFIWTLIKYNGCICVCCVLIMKKVMFNSVENYRFSIVICSIQ